MIKLQIKHEKEKQWRDLDTIFLVKLQLIDNHHFEDDRLVLSFAKDVSLEIGVLVKVFIGNNSKNMTDKGVFRLNSLTLSNSGYSYSAASNWNPNGFSTKYRHFKYEDKTPLVKALKEIAERYGWKLVHQKEIETYFLKETSVHETDAKSLKSILSRYGLLFKISNNCLVIYADVRSKNYKGIDIPTHSIPKANITNWSYSENYAASAYTGVMATWGEKKNIVFAGSEQNALEPPGNHFLKQEQASDFVKKKFGEIQKEGTTFQINVTSTDNYNSTEICCGHFILIDHLSQKVNKNWSISAVNHTIEKGVLSSSLSMEIAKI